MNLYLTSFIIIFICFFTVKVFLHLLKKNKTPYPDTHTHTIMAFIKDGALTVKGKSYQTQDDLSELHEGDSVAIFIINEKAYLVK